MTTILVKIEGGIVQEILADKKNAVKVIVMDKDDESSQPISITEYTPGKGNILKEINEARLSNINIRIGDNVTVKSKKGDDFMGTLVNVKINRDNVLLVVEDQNGDIFDVESTQVVFDN